MKTNKTTDNIRIVINANLGASVQDKRNNYYGLEQGTLESLAKQYGINVTDVKGVKVFSAPKSRMQRFVEKIHFARISYKEI